MTLAIAHRDGDRVVLDAVRERRPPFSPDDVTLEFAALLKAYRVREVSGDRYGGEWPAERFRARGITYVPAEKPLPILNAHRAELLDLPRRPRSYAAWSGARRAVDATISIIRPEFMTTSQMPSPARYAALGAPRPLASRPRYWLNYRMPQNTGTTRLGTPELRLDGRLAKCDGRDLGGVTGTGASPVVARAARELGILTIGVVTKPFHFEGQRRMRLAEAGIMELQKSIDTLIVANEKTTFTDAFDGRSGAPCWRRMHHRPDSEGRPHQSRLRRPSLVRAVMREMGAAGLHDPRRRGRESGADQFTEQPNRKAAGLQ